MMSITSHNNNQQNMVPTTYQHSTPNPPNKSSKQPTTNKTKHSKAIMNTEARRDNQNPRPANTRSKEYELDP